MKLDIDKLDFDHCEDEPIHIPEAIQGYGYLFAIEDDGTIRIISENVQQLFLDHERIIGSNFYNLLKDEQHTEFLKETHERTRQKQNRLPLQLLFKDELIMEGHKSDFYAVVYKSDNLFVIELEPAARFREIYSARHFIKLYAMSIAPKFSSYHSLEKMSQEIVDTIKEITGMERVVLYRFKEDNSGQVIAEAREEDIDSYLNLHYPASDIPSQARELYRKNWIRLMANVDLEPSRLIPTIAESQRKPLDMTYSFLRDLSPIHRQYISNQGLKSSLSMSLVTHGQLWGMISCHSREPRYIPQNVRLECENLSQLFSWHLYAKEEELRINRKEKTEKSIERITEKISLLKPIVEVFLENEKEVLEIAKADGFMYFSESDHVSLGRTPELSVIQELFTNSYTNKSRPFSTTDLSEHILETESLNGMRGILLIPLIEQKNYFTAWFRKETIQHQKWAGAPKETKPSDSKKDRLSPRSSFKVHEVSIKGHSIPWDSHDIEVATRFNRVFISHALERQEKMREEIINLELQDKYKNEFLATLAHELRNPLSPITTGISLLEIEDNQQLRFEVLNTMKRQVSNMTNMINDLLDVSRITQGKVNIQKEPIRITEVLNDALATCRDLLKNKDHQLDLQFPNPSPWVLGDRTRLSQIFSNLLNNAAKYTDNDGHIQITVQTENEEIVVKVKDNGIGIPAENLDSIFSMFTQVKNGNTKSGDGLGIGLTLVRRLVALHDGRIYARSPGNNRGSEFEVRLPKHDYNERELLEETDDQGSDPGNTEKKVLLIDDNEDLGTILRLMLKSAGYKIRIAKTGQEALEIFGDFKPDAAIVDIGLPDMNGFTLFESLKERYDTDQTAFFSHSGLGNKEQTDKSKSLGFKEHFVKPVQSQVLIKALQNYLSDE